MSPVGTILIETWAVLVDAAPFMLLGLLAAGLLKAFLPKDFIGRHLGGQGRASVLKASVIGAPLPLCSCGVVPTAAGLRDQGAGKGATAAFLISTPETGVDSLAVTYALLDPFMTIVRPISAVLTAITAGLLTNLADQTNGKKEASPVTARQEASASHMNQEPETTESNPGSVPTCGCSGCGCSLPAPEPRGLFAKLAYGMRYAFAEILPDIGMWFLAGVLLAGLLTVLLPDSFFSNDFGSGIWGMLLVLAFSVPLYVCATSSTPIAAALVLKGLSPGAALVFLLAGPATNAASMTMVSRLLGIRAMGAYLAAILFCSLGMGLLTNQAYAALGLDTSSWLAAETGEHGGVFAPFCAGLLTLLILSQFIRQRIMKLRNRRLAEEEGLSRSGDLC